MKNLLGAVTVGAIVVGLLALMRRANREATAELHGWDGECYLVGIEANGESIELKTAFPFLGTEWSVGGGDE